MAMGLGFLGRESLARSTVVGGLHVLAAALGGAVTGAALGALGELLDIAGTVAAWILIVAGAVALLIALSRRPVKIGRPCQVPKKWSRTMPANRLYSAWGLMLGSGPVTLIPYSAYLLLAAAQLVSGPLIGALSGALFGLARETLALTGISGGLQPGPAMDSLERLARPARVSNAVVVAVGAVLLVITVL